MALEFKPDLTWMPTLMTPVKAVEVAGTGTLSNVSTTTTDSLIATLRFTGAAPSVTGLEAKRQKIHLMAVGGDLILKHEDSGSLAANRIDTGGSDITVAQGGVAELVYDAQSSRWRVAAGGGSPGGGDINTDNTVVQQARAQVTTTNATPQQVTFEGDIEGNTIPIPSGATVVLDLQVTASQAGAAKSKTFNVRRIFNNLAGTVTASTQTNLIAPIEVGGSLACSPAIEYTGTNARVELTGVASTNLRWRVDIQVTTITAAAAVAPVLTSLNFDLADTGGGGQNIVATGTDLAGALSATWGGTACTVIGSTSTTVTVQLPAKAAGSHDLIVTTAGGASNALPIEAWDPKQITGVDGYFDSRKNLSVTGSDVTAWTEQVDAEVFAAAGTGTVSRVADIFGTGIPAVRFGSGGARLQTGVNRALTTAAGVFWVGKWTASGTTRAAFGCARCIVSEGGGNNNYGMYGTGLDYYGYNGGVINTDTDGEAGADGLNDGTTRLVGWTHASGQPAKAYKGATQVYSTAMAYPSPAQWSAIGAERAGDANGADADVAAIVVCDAVPSGGDITKLHKWARQSFGAAS